MRGVVSLAAAFAVPADDAVGRPVPRPAAAGVPDVRGGGRHAAAARADAAVADPGARRPERRRPRDALRAGRRPDQGGPGRRRPARRGAGRAARRTDVHERAADGPARLERRGGSNAAWERLGRGDDEIGESPAAAFRRLRLEMLAAEREAFIAERDAGTIDDEVLRSVLRGLDLEEASAQPELGTSDTVGAATSARKARMPSTMAPRRGARPRDPRRTDPPAGRLCSRTLAKNCGATRHSVIGRSEGSPCVGRLGSVSRRRCPVSTIRSTRYVMAAPDKLHLLRRSPAVRRAPESVSAIMTNSSARNSLADTLFWSAKAARSDPTPTSAPEVRPERCSSCARVGHSGTCGHQWLVSCQWPSSIVAPLQQRSWDYSATDQ